METDARCEDERVPAPTPPPPSLQKATRRVVAVMLVAVALYFAFALASGPKKLGGEMGDFHWWTFVAAIALAFGNYLLRFLKWQYYLAKLEIRGIPVSTSFLTFLSGFVLSVTPGKVGEVFKSLILFETAGVPIARTAPIVIAERLTDLIGIIALIAAGSTRFSGGILLAVAGAIVVSALLVVIASRRISAWGIRLIERMPRMGPRIGPKLRDAYESLHLLTRGPVLVLPTLLSVAAWFLECLALWVILRGFGAVASVLGASFFYATSTLAGALVPVPGGLGVTEMVMKTMISQVGNVNPVIAMAAMLLVRFATLWFAVLVGFAALYCLRRRYPMLLRSSPSP